MKRDLPGADPDPFSVIPVRRRTTLYPSRALGTPLRPLPGTPWLNIDLRAAGGAIVWAALAVYPAGRPRLQKEASV